MEPLNHKRLLICYVRHGQTFDNIDGIIAGHSPGKLTQTGILQAHQTGEMIKNAPFHHIYVSDLNRTRETYEGIIQKAKGLASIEPVFTSLLREKGGGVLEGKKLHLWGENAKREKVGIRKYKCPKG